MEQCREHGIQAMASSILCGGRTLDSEAVKFCCKELEKTPAQVGELRGESFRGEVWAGMCVRVLLGAGISSRAVSCFVMLVAGHHSMAASGGWAAG